jgi:hypothetical protein
VGTTSYFKDDSLPQIHLEHELAPRQPLLKRTVQTNSRDSANGALSAEEGGKPVKASPQRRNGQRWMAVDEVWSLAHSPVSAGKPRWRCLAGIRGGGQTLDGLRWRRARADLDAVERRGGRRRARGTAEGQRGGLRTRMVARGDEGRRRRARPAADGKLGLERNREAADEYEN